MEEVKRSDKIYYKKVLYKYQLAERFVDIIDIKGYDIKTDFISLNPQGVLIAEKNYAWDGPSGPTIDTPNSIRGSLVHDILYQLIELQLIAEINKKYGDKLLRAYCRKDGMSWVRAWYWYWTVKKFGGTHINSEVVDEVICLPVRL